MAGDKKLKIHYETTADTKGSKEAAAGVKEVKEATQQATPQIDKLSTSKKAATESARLLTKQKKELTQVIHALGHSIPGLDSALHLLKSPVAGVAAVAATAVLLFHKFNEELKELERRSEAWAHLSDSIGRGQVIMAQSRIEAENFARAMAEAARQVETVSEKLERQISVIHEQARVGAEVHNTEKAALLAGVENTEQAAAKKLAIEKAFFEAKSILQKKALEEEIAATKSAEQGIREEIGDASFEHGVAKKEKEEAQKLLGPVQMAADLAESDFADKKPKLLEAIKEAREKETEALKHLDDTRARAKAGDATAQRNLPAKEDVYNRAKLEHATARENYQQELNTRLIGRAK
jgi:hypothetical protein